MPTASLGIRIRESTLHCSQTIRAVMILVVLAIRAFSSPFRENSTLPVRPSMATALLADTAWVFTGNSKTAARKTAAVLANNRFMFLTRD